MKGRSGKIKINCGLTAKLAKLITLDHFPRLKGPLSFILCMTESVKKPSSSTLEGRHTQMAKIHE